MRLLVSLGSAAIACLLSSLASAQGKTLRLASQYLENAYEIDGTIGSLVELSDGRSVISDIKTNELRILDWNENTARLLGSRGKGPGEYSLIERLIGLSPDSALVYDRSSLKLLIATKAGLREFARLQPPTNVRIYLRGADQTGRYLYVAGSHFRWPGESLTKNGPLSAAESIFVLIARGPNGAPDTVAKVRGPSQRLVRTSMSLGEGQPTVQALIANPLSGGDAVAMFPDGWVAIAYRDAYRVDWLSPTGHWVRGPKLDSKETRLDQRLKEQVIADLKNEVPNATVTLFKDWPDVLPPFVDEALVQSHDGRVLVPRTRVGSAGRIYDVINRLGRREATLEVPVAATLQFVGRMGLYVLFSDENGIRHVRRYPSPFR